MRKIVNNNTLYYQTDFEYDIEIFKAAAPGSHFIIHPTQDELVQGCRGLMRDSETDLYTERDVHIHNAAAHNGWRYYSDSKYYSVRAFAVEVRDNLNGMALAGDIYEPHYNKHTAEVRQNTFNANSVKEEYEWLHKLMALDAESEGMER